MTDREQNPISQISALLPLAAFAKSFAVLVTYLDDSDSDIGPVLTIGGILIPANQIEAFERSLESYFSEKRVDVLHTKNFAQRKKEFAEWTPIERTQFAGQLFNIASAHGVHAIASSIRKKDFKRYYRREEGMQNMSAIGYAFGKIVTSCMKIDSPDNLPISFIIEAGNKNNGNITSYFNWVKRKLLKKPDEVFGSITLVDKKSCRAIQVADFVAFYSRKAAEKWDRDGYPRPLTNTEMLQVISHYVPFRFERSFGPVTRVVDSSEVHTADHSSASWFPNPGKRGI